MMTPHRQMGIGLIAICLGLLGSSCNSRFGAGGGLLRLFGASSVSMGPQDLQGDIHSVELTSNETPSGVALTYTVQGNVFSVPGPSERNIETAIRVESLSGQEICSAKDRRVKKTMDLVTPLTYSISCQATAVEPSRLVESRGPVRVFLLVKVFSGNSAPPAADQSHQSEVEASTTPDPVFELAVVDFTPHQGTVPLVRSQSEVDCSPQLVPGDQRARSDTLINRAQSAAGTCKMNLSCRCTVRTSPSGTIVSDRCGLKNRKTTYHAGLICRSGNSCSGLKQVYADNSGGADLLAELSRRDDNGVVASCKKSLDGSSSTELAPVP